eukprot:TRINITY_DN28634_c0_g1_i1.p1 TRINITY_DN28634_c0_g1~~TRINITY_DN28634_c0_g1_i1.p1  ORF type:complete len:1262 (-),score=266.49 TRINITY_DN28634_c0_g1_i1:227-3685(-)
MARLPSLQHRSVKKDALEVAAKKNQVMMQSTTSRDKWASRQIPSLTSTSTSFTAFADRAYKTFGGSEAASAPDAVVSWGQATRLNALAETEMKRIESLKRLKAATGNDGPPGCKVTHMTRKNSQLSALAHDRKYVIHRLDETSEKTEDRHARARVFNDHWLATLLYPIPRPWEILTTELRERLPPAPMDPSVAPVHVVPEEKQDDLQILTKISLSLASPTSTLASPAAKSILVSPKADDKDGAGSSAGDSVEDDSADLEWETGDVREIVVTCLQFQALETPPAQKGRKELSVMSRCTFCRLIGALDGLFFQGKVRMGRALACFDEFTESFTFEDVDGKAKELKGVRLSTIPDKGGKHNLDFDMLTELDLEELPIVKLFTRILQDMISDLREAPRGFRRESAAVYTRNVFFDSLLPKAKGYGDKRTAFVQAQIDAAMAQDLKIEQARAEAKRERAEDEADAADVDDTSSSHEAEDAELEAPTDNGSRLYTHTFVVLKGETLACQLMDPEVMRLMIEITPLCSQLFDAYADIPTACGQGSMSLTALLRFCGDFALFPNHVDYKTIHWLYSTAGGVIELPPPPEAPTPAKVEVKDNEIEKPLEGKGKSKGKRKGKQQTQPEEGKRKGKRQQQQPPEEKSPLAGCIFYLGKWIKEHLHWMTKSATEQTAAERRSLAILHAMSDWMSGQGVSSAELFGFKDGEASEISLGELQQVVKFMNLDAPPTEADVEKLLSLLLPPIEPPASVVKQEEPPSPSPTSPAQKTKTGKVPRFAQDETSSPSSPTSPTAKLSSALKTSKPAPKAFPAAPLTEREPGPSQEPEQQLPEKLGFDTLQMALMAVGKMKERDCRATNLFLGEISKMSREESNAAIFFREVYHYAQATDVTPDELFDKMDVDLRGVIPATEMVTQVHELFRRAGLASPALSIDYPFYVLDKKGDSMLRKEVFVRLLKQVKKAEKHRALQDTLHPIFLASATEEMPHKKKGARLFGLTAFVETVVKIGLEHLTHHGNATQKELSLYHKLIWLVTFLLWSFDCQKEKVATMARPQTTASVASSCASRPVSRPRSRPLSGFKGEPDRPYPMYKPPISLLMERKPRLFVDALKEPPGWALQKGLEDVLLQNCISKLKKARAENEDTFVAFDRLLLEAVTSCREHAF